MIRIAIAFLSLLTPLLHAGDLIIKVPKDAVVVVADNKIEVDPKTGKATLRFSDSGLDPSRDYGYTVHVTLGTEKKEKSVLIKIGGTTSVDFTSDFRIANGSTLPQPRLMAQSELEQRKKSVVIPESIKSLEPQADLYAEYLNFADSLDLKKLGVGETDRKITCSVWTLGQSRKFDTELVLDNSTVGNGRYVNSYVKDFEKEYKENFLLLFKENFWRGKSTEKSAVKSHTVAGTDFANMARPGQFNWSISSTAFHGATPLLNSEPYLCFSGSSNNPGEFFLELGYAHAFTANLANTGKDVKGLETIKQTGFTVRKTTTHDASGRPLSPNVIHSDTSVSWADARTAALNRPEIKSGVPGFCYKSTEDTTYSMKAIGTCYFRKNK